MAPVAFAISGIILSSQSTYTKVGDYYIPDLVLDEPEPVRTIGKYGSLRRSYLKQHRRSFYQELVTSGKLQDHLIDIEDTRSPVFHIF